MKSSPGGTLKNPKAPTRWYKGRKRCVKGKSCRATCIHRKLLCQVELGGLVSKNLTKVSETRKNSPVAAHPLLVKDFTEEKVAKALESISELDKDAGRRAAILMKLFRTTKTVFIDWKDVETNRKVFVAATSGVHKDPVAKFNEKVDGKTWAGVAFWAGSTLVKASPGFEPSVKQVRTLVNRQLKQLKDKGEILFSVGKGTKAPGNNPLVTLVHELGHHAHFKTKSALLDPYTVPVSMYGKTNNDEKFAELFTAYIFSGPKLRQLYPMEYEAVEKILSKGGLL